MIEGRKKKLLFGLTCLVLSLAVLAAVPGFGTGRLLATSLSGAAEVPDPGDADGTGSAEIRLNPGQQIVCWSIQVSDITLPAAAAHIHDAAAGVAGPVLVPLSAPNASGLATGCTFVARAVIKEILRNPDEYYVNVHTSDFPAGALRGQLSK